MLCPDEISDKQNKRIPFLTKNLPPFFRWVLHYGPTHNLGTMPSYNVSKVWKKTKRKNKNAHLFKTLTIDVSNLKIFIITGNIFLEDRLDQINNIIPTFFFWLPQGPFFVLRPKSQPQSYLLALGKRVPSTKWHFLRPFEMNFHNNFFFEFQQD